MQLLRVRHSSPRTLRWGHLPGQTKACASRRSGHRSGNRSATPQGPSKRTFGREPTCELPFRDVVLTERDKQLLPELRRASVMAFSRCVVSRYARARAKSLEGAMSGHQSFAVLCRFRCRLLLAEIPKGVDRNSELKNRLQLWELEQISVLIGKVLGQQNSGTLRRTARKTQLQTDEKAGSGPHPAKCADAARSAWGRGRTNLRGAR